MDPFFLFSYFNFINLYLRSICLYLHSFHLPVPSLNDSNLTMQLEDLDWKFDIVSNQYFRFFIWFGNQIHVMRIPNLIPHPLTLKATERQRTMCCYALNLPNMLYRVVFIMSFVVLQFPMYHWNICCWVWDFSMTTALETCFIASMNMKQLVDTQLPICVNI